MKNKQPLQPNGFSLIELAIVMSIIALLIGGMMMPLSKKFEQQAYSDTQLKLDKAVETLIGFAILNGRLPCPSVADTGVEQAANATANGCASQSDSLGAGTGLIGASWGDLPWATLGIAAPDNADAWGNRIRYAVYTPLVTNFTALGASNLVVRCASDTKAVLVNIPGCFESANPISAANPLQLSNTVSFVVYSHGGNWRGASSMDIPPITYPQPDAMTAGDERDNTPNNQPGTTAVDRNNRSRFIMRVRTDQSGAGGEFDDVVTWVSRNTLAAKLPASVWTPP